MSVDRPIITLEQRHELSGKLLQNVHNSLPTLYEMVSNITREWNSTDSLYRFYHHSFKMYNIQTATLAIVTALKTLDPKETPYFDESFEKLIADGTGREWERWHNKCWNQFGNAMFLAYFHAEAVLLSLLRSAETLDHSPIMLPSPWALCLEVFCLR